MTARKLTCLDCGQVNKVPEARLDAGPKCGTCGARLMPGTAVAIDLATLRKAARHDEVPLVVDFWAPWCGPCKMMAPEFDRAAGQAGTRARLVKLNTQDEAQAAGAYNIRGIPTMIRFHRGREAARQSGMMKSEQILRWIG